MKSLKQLQSNVDRGTVFGKAIDGTKLNATSLNNFMLGWQGALLAEAGLIPNNRTETIGDSQIVDSIKRIAEEIANSTLGTGGLPIFYGITVDVSGLPQIDLVAKANEFTEITWFKDGVEVSMPEGSDQFKIEIPAPDPAIHDGVYHFDMFSDGVFVKRSDPLDFKALDYDNTIYGTENVDTLNGTADNDTIKALGDNDTVNAGDGDDIIHASEGDDILSGDAGNDIYIWGTTLGNDTINDFNATDAANVGHMDIVRFTSDLTKSDINWTKDTNNLVATIPSGETLTITDYYLADDYKVERFELHDNTEITAAEIELSVNTIYGTENADNIGGDTLNVINEKIVGLGGADILQGHDGDDILDGSADGVDGDTLKGGGGDDTYIWGVGYGDDYIDERSTYNGVAAGNDTLIIKGVNSFDDLTFYLSRPSSTVILNIMINSTGENLGIYNHYQEDGDTDYVIEKIVLEDSGLELDEAGILAKVQDIQLQDGLNLGTSPNSILGGTITGTDGDDNIYGVGGNDTLMGGGGTDSLFGGDGDDYIDGGEADGVYDSVKGDLGKDTFIWGKGDGDQTIEDREYVDNTIKDRLILRNIASWDDLFFYIKRPSSSYNMIIHIRETGEECTIAAGVSESDTTQYRIEEYELQSTGEVKTYAEIEALLSNMIVPEGFTTSLSNYFLSGNIIGNSSNNSYSGSSGNDSLDGAGGADTLTGGDGDDTLTGGDDDGVRDSLVGDDGADTYIWSAGDGDDDIHDNSLDGSIDRLIIKGVDSINKLSFSIDKPSSSWNNYSLLITLIETGEILELQSYWQGDDDVAATNNARGHIEEIFIEDANVTLTKTDINTMMGNLTQLSTQNAGDFRNYFFSGTLTTNDNDGSIYGLGGDDEIIGGAGSTQLYGGTGADIMDGGAGDGAYDAMNGEAGADTYIWSAGRGDDRINDNSVDGSTDRLIIKGISDINELAFTIDKPSSSWNNYSLEITINATSETLTILNYWQGTDDEVLTREAYGCIEEILIEDANVTLTKTDVNAMFSTITQPAGDTGSMYNYFFSGTMILNSTSSSSMYGQGGDDKLVGNDQGTTLSGGDGNDELYGGAGNDSLDGGYGDDILSGGTEADGADGTYDSLQGYQGDDTYHWGVGYGDDFIKDDNYTTNTETLVGDNADKLRIHGVSDANELAFNWDSTSYDTYLLIKIKSSGDTLKVYMSNRDKGIQERYIIETIELDGGVTYTMAQFADFFKTLDGTDTTSTIYDHSNLASIINLGASNNQYAYGNAGNDTIYGGTGTSQSLDGGYGDDKLYSGADFDKLEGSYGSDTYYWNVAHNDVTIDSANVEDDNTVIDKVIIVGETDAANISVTVNGSHWDINHTPSGNSARIVYAVNHVGQDYGIDSIELEDGTVIPTP